VKPFATADLCDQFGDDVRVARPVFRDWGGAASFGGVIETVQVFEDNALARQVVAVPERGRGGGGERV
jgi:regulator of ribonuclease activity A